MAFPECSLRAKCTQGLECELASLAGFGLQIRSPLGACPVPPRCSSRARPRGYIGVAADDAARGIELRRRGVGATIASVASARASRARTTVAGRAASQLNPGR